MSGDIKQVGCYHVCLSTIDGKFWLHATDGMNFDKTMNIGCNKRLCLSIYKHITVKQIEHNMT